MKAIIITDAEARSLLDSLELAKLKDAGHLRGQKITDEMQAAHGTYHYVVCRRLQEMGADVVGRGR